MCLEIGCSKERDGGALALGTGWHSPLQGTAMPT